MSSVLTYWLYSRKERPKRGCSPAPASFCSQPKGKTDRLIADLLQGTPETVRNIRKRFATEGLEAALQERPRPGAQPKLDGKQEALLVALACSAPPEGREHWTMHLLADRLVELEAVESISDETVRRVLKKTRPAKSA